MDCHPGTMYDVIEPVSRAMNVAVLQMADRVLPTGFDVIDNGPNTYDDLVAGINMTGRVRVDRWNSPTSVYASEEVSWAARAWHDWTHFRYKIPFGLFGEINTFIHQRADLSATYGHGRQFQEFVPILLADVVGQNIYAYNHGGKFPVDQQAFYRAFISDGAVLGLLADMIGGWNQKLLGFAGWATMDAGRRVLTATSPDASF